MTGLVQDFRYTTRQLRREPGFTAVAVLTLTLGIGANTGIFTLVNAVLLKSLPVPNPEQLFLVRQGKRFAEQTRVSYPLYDRMLRAMPASASLAAMTRVSDFYLGTANSQPEMAKGQLASGNFFQTFETYPLLGRLLGPEDNLTIDGHPVAVISYGCWKRHFAAQADVVGRELVVNGVHFTVVGVAAPDFFGAEPGKSPDVWLPLMMQSALHFSQHYSKGFSADSTKPWVSQDDITWLNLVVRAHDRGELGHVSGVLNQLFLQDPWERRARGMSQRRQISESQLDLEPGGQGIQALEREFLRPLLVLTGIVGIVLLIACANLASLMLARAAARTREIAVRLSIGATRSRLVLQLLTECLLLSLLGAVLGISVAYGCDLVLPKWASPGSLPIALNLAPDLRVLLFTLSITILTAVLFGLVPAYRTANVDPAHAVKISQSGSHGTRGERQWSLRHSLVALQFALSLVLLFGAGLFLRTLTNFERLNPGFDRDRILTVWLDTGIRHYSPEELRTFYHRVIDRIEALAGVESASLAACGIASSCHSSSDIWVPGHSEVRATPQTNIVSLHYFQNVGMRLLRGRDFTSADDLNAPHVAIINQTLARRLFPEIDPIGQRFGFDPGSAGEFQVVGIVQDAQLNSIRESAPPMIYFPLLEGAANVESLDVRAISDPAALTEQVRQVLNSVDPDLPIGNISTLTDQVKGNLSEQRLIARLTSIFAAVALSLACVGLYGVMSYSAVRRTAELGIRLALGASRGAVLWLMLRYGLVVIGTGVVPGVVLSLLAARTVRSFLFGLSPSDPATLLFVALLLAIVAMAAGVKPAWRAAHLDPSETLRVE
jgi:predicted permease